MLSSCAALAIAVAGIQESGAQAAETTAQSRLLYVWLDLRLVEIFYPSTTAATLPENLGKLARQLNQPPILTQFGERPRDTFRFAANAVVIKQHPPKDTWILFSRDAVRIWRLVDDPAGHMTLLRIAGP